MLCTCSIQVFAQENTSQEEQDENFTIIEEDGTLYIIKNEPCTRMGGGIGWCKDKPQKKTFSYTITRTQAKNAIKATTVGEGAVKSLGTLLSAVVPGGVGIAASIVMNFLGGESAYIRKLKNFIDSGKSKAKLTFKTHCVDRGKSYGDPIYDYAVDSVSIQY